MNQVNIIGNLGSEPEVKVFQSGKKVARFSVAVNGYSKNKENQPAPTWITCEMWDAAVDRLLKCKEKAKLSGRKIQITGSLALNVYTTTVGTEPRTVKKLYVKVHSFELLGGLKTDEAQEDSALTTEQIEDEFAGAEVTELPTEFQSRLRA